MTKFILHGEVLSLPSIYNKNFFIEIVESLSEPVKILAVYFATSKGKWEELLKDDKRKFSTANPNKELAFTMANDILNTLVKQISSTDVVYIRGGDEPFVYEIFSKLKNLAELFQGKVVAGSSTGAYVLSKYFYSNNEDRIVEGTGILPIKTFAHWSEDKSDKLEKLKEYGEDLEIYTIPEAEFVVIKK